ncbi:MAG: WYL domain-containing protein [Oscillospiraceae bacterium]|jgi:predicted DNA-binding transcriptional regulator YafY|nr:WYL domain-containing protein [Oscillospiraceae bacterium]
MQLSRLLDIYYRLLKRQRVTVRELAERFGVPERTIHRDVEALNIAGVPVYIARGTEDVLTISDTYALGFPLLTDAKQRDHSTFTVIQMGLSRRRALCIDYHSAQGEATQRTVYPLLLQYRARTWYLHAFCTLRSDFRMFRLDRVERIVLLDRRFRRSAYL